MCMRGESENGPRSSPEAYWLDNTIACLLSEAVGTCGLEIQGSQRGRSLSVHPLGAFIVVGCWLVVSAVRPFTYRSILPHRDGATAYARQHSLQITKRGAVSASPSVGFPNIHLPEPAAASTRGVPRK